MSIWYLQAVQNGLVLDAEHASIEPVGNVLQWKYHGGVNQQWRIECDGSDTFRIV
jgi:hypothetical protein